MQFSASQIAAMTGGDVEGNPEVLINSFAKIEEGHPGAISFLANPKYTHFIYTTEASAVLVSRDFVAEKPVSTTLIRVDDPYATVASLLDMASRFLQPNPTGIEQPCFIAEGVEIPDDIYIGAFAYIAPGATIAPGARIYPGAYIGHKVSIGANTIIYPGAKIYWGCRIGANCIIHSGAVIGADGFGFAPTPTGYNKIPQLGIVDIRDNVEIGANTTIDRATMGATVIEAGTKLDNLIQVAHNCVVGSDTVIAAQAGVAGSAKIGKRCMIGGQVGIAGHIEIGDRVQIGAQSGIPNNVPSDRRLMGYPAVDASKFARQSVQIKNLGDLYARVAELEKRLAAIDSE